MREHSYKNNGIDMEIIRDREVEGDRVDDKVGDGAVVTGEVINHHQPPKFPERS